VKVAKSVPLTVAQGRMPLVRAGAAVKLTRLEDPRPAPAKLTVAPGLRDRPALVRVVEPVTLKVEPPLATVTAPKVSVDEPPK